MGVQNISVLWRPTVLSVWQNQGVKLTQSSTKALVNWKRRLTLERSKITRCSDLGIDAENPRVVHVLPICFNCMDVSLRIHFIKLTKGWSCEVTFQCNDIISLNLEILAFLLLLSVNLRPQAYIEQIRTFLKWCVSLM